MLMDQVTVRSIQNLRRMVQATAVMMLSTNLRITLRVDTLATHRLKKAQVPMCRRLALQVI